MPYKDLEKKRENARQYHHNVVKIKTGDALEKQKDIAIKYVRGGGFAV